MFPDVGTRMYIQSQSISKINNRGIIRNLSDFEFENSISVLNLNYSKENYEYQEEDEIKLLISQKRFALHKKLDNIFYARLQFLIRLLYNIDATMAEYYAEKNGIKLIK